MSGESRRIRRRRAGIGVVLSFAAVGLATAVLLRPPHGRLAEGRAAYDSGRWRDALTRANQVLRDEPNDADALRLSARASARLGRDSSVVSLYNRLGSKGATSEDLFLLADALVRQGHVSEGERMLLNALKAEPGRGETLDSLTKLYERSDRLAEAAGLAERLARVSGYEVSGSSRLGMINERRNETEGAVEAWRAALRSNSPTVATAPLRKHLARNLLRLGRPLDAEEALLNVSAAAADPEADWLLSRAALQRGKKSDALDASRRVASASGDEPLAASYRFGPEPAPYTGAARCGECHRDEYEAQQSSRHARTFRRAEEVASLNLPAARFEDSAEPKVVATVKPEGGPGALKVEVGSDVYRAVIDYMLGSGRHACTPVGRDESGVSRELRVTYYASIHGWDRTPGQPVKPGDPRGYLGEPQTADSLRRCLGCHTTNYRAAIAGTGSRAGPESADRGIGCETCHGPGGNHVAAVSLGLDDPAIARFRPTAAGIRPRVMTACGECHGTQGRSLPQDTPAATVRFQGTTLTWSRCFEQSRSALDCLTCHPAHRDSEEPPAFYEGKCLQCHQPGRAEHVACKVNPRGECLGCHMPKVPSIVPHATFTDHHIRVRRGREAAPSPSADKAADLR